jgi:malate dehydrogenase (oxaloacetate-decarboxylating)(NADP+)
MTEPTQDLTGYDRLRNPRLNKGTAFTEAERRAFGLEGLLPPAVLNIELQVARRRAEIANLDEDLQKYLVLLDLQARNETLFYAVLMSDPATYMPLVYTPTVGEACQNSAISTARRAACICRSTLAAGSGRSSATGRKEMCASS